MNNTFPTIFYNDKIPRQALISYLRDYCKNYDTEKIEIIKKCGGGFDKRNYTKTLNKK